MQACDVFDLVELEAEFVAANREALAANPVMEQSVLDRLKTAIRRGRRSSGVVRGRGALRACIIWASWWAV